MSFITWKYIYDMEKEKRKEKEKEKGEIVKRSLGIKVDELEWLLRAAAHALFPHLLSTPLSKDSLC